MVVRVFSGGAGHASVALAFERQCNNILHAFELEETCFLREPFHQTVDIREL